MLKINNKDCEVTEETIKFTKSKINNKEGYSMLLSVDFNGGYLSFYIDFFDKKDLKKIENQIFTKEQIKMFELYSNKKFIDYIDGDIFLKFDNINNNHIKASLEVNDLDMALQYNGLLLLDKD